MQLPVLGLAQMLMLELVQAQEWAQPELPPAQVQPESALVPGPALVLEWAFVPG